MVGIGTAGFRWRGPCFRLSLLSTVILSEESALISTRPELQIIHFAPDDSQASL